MTYKKLFDLQIRAFDEGNYDEAERIMRSYLISMERQKERSRELVQELQLPLEL